MPPASSARPDRERQRSRRRESGRSRRDTADRGRSRRRTKERDEPKERVEPKRSRPADGAEKVRRQGASGSGQSRKAPAPRRAPTPRRASTPRRKPAPETAKDEESSEAYAYEYQSGDGEDESPPPAPPSAVVAPVSRGFELRGSVEQFGIDRVFVRRTKRLLDEDRKQYLAWGETYRGGDDGDGWFHLTAGGFVPAALDGVQIAFEVAKKTTPKAAPPLQKRLPLQAKAPPSRQRPEPEVSRPASSAAERPASAGSAARRPVSGAAERVSQSQRPAEKKALSGPPRPAEKKALSAAGSASASAGVEPPEQRTLPGGKVFVVQGDSKSYDGDGIVLRQSKSYYDCYEVKRETMYEWGDQVRGHLEGEWVVVDGGGFLPVFLDGDQVIFEAGDAPSGPGPGAPATASAKASSVRTPSRSPRRGGPGGGTQRALGRAPRSPSVSPGGSQRAKGGTKRAWSQAESSAWDSGGDAGESGWTQREASPPWRSSKKWSAAGSQAWEERQTEAKGEEQERAGVGLRSLRRVKSPLAYEVLQVLRDFGGPCRCVGQGGDEAEARQARRQGSSSGGLGGLGVRYP